MQGKQAEHIPNVRDASQDALRVPTMKRRLLLSLLATLAAWLLIRNSSSNKRAVPAQEAAAKLQKAWADHHTTA
jgi:hypothetical protein